MNKTHSVLIFSLVLFAVFVGYLIYKQAEGGGGSILVKEEVISFFTERINEVSPENPVLGGKWFVTRFRFVGDNHVYVEYEDGHIARAFLLSLTKSTGSIPDYKIVGYFEPGPMEFKLLSGEDTQKRKAQEIYEYSETAKKWIRVN
jgi:hypothetical protein